MHVYIPKHTIFPPRSQNQKALSLSLSPMTQKEEFLTLELIRHHLLGELNSTETHIDNLNFHISQDESLVISEESKRSCSKSGSNCLNTDPTHCDSLPSASKLVNPDRNCSDYETKTRNNRLKDNITRHGENGSTRFCRRVGF